MKKTILALVCALVGLQGSVSQAQNTLPVPVVDRSPTGNTSVGSNPGAVSPRATSRPMAVVQPSANAELLMMVEQLQEEVRFLRGQLEEMAHQTKKMRTNQRDRYRDLDRRISGLNRQMSGLKSPQSVVTSVPPVSRPSDDTKVPSVETKLDTPKTVSTVVSQAPRITDRQAYKEAFGLVRQRSFDKALTAFTDFLRNYPSSTLLPNVLYWTGEVYRAKPKPNQELARQAYSRLVEEFPKHQKAADGYYKLGLSHALSGDDAKAKLMMQKVVGSYPSQSPAKLAQDYLNKISKKK